MPISGRRNVIIRAFMFFLPIVFGVLGFIWMSNQSSAQVEATEEAKVAVRIMEVTAAPREIVATGFGRVTPTRERSAISDVQGRITSLALGLAEGRIVSSGEVLIKIDPTDYILAIERANASISSVNAQLAELDLQEQNTIRSLELQNQILEVSQAELDRVGSLVSSGASTRAALENAQSAFLAQESAVLNLENTLNLIPSQRAALEASLQAERVSLSEAETSLARTEIAAPFRGRIASLNAETSQFVRTGDVLLELEAVDAVEVVAEFQPQTFFPIAANITGTNSLASGSFDAANAVDLLIGSGVEARVRLNQFGGDQSFDATLTRLRGTIAEDTGTLGIVVQVDDPMMIDTTQSRPPLNVGAFVSVDLIIASSNSVIAVPRTALHYDDAGDPFVFVADADDRLEFRSIEPGYILGDLITVAAGLETGDRLLLSDPRPPIEGLKLIPLPSDRDS